MGFSDITALLLGIQKKTGVVTFHGPVGNSGLNDFTWDSLQSVLIKKENTFYENKEKVTLTPGIAKGILIGGNLSVLTSIIGSDYLPDFSGKILFLEDAEEEPYSIDRMLTQLRLGGFLKNITGVIFGKCAKCVAEEPDKAFTYEQMIEQNIKPLGIPAFYNASFGHVENKSTLPLGIKAEMDAEKGTIRLLENAVK
jgi:muramoyltetrapeptide carboxypeptidase